MITLYTIPTLEGLVRMHKRGMIPDYVLYDSLDDAEERAYEEENVIVSVTLEDPDKFLEPDWDRVQHDLEWLNDRSRPAVEGEIATGFTDDFTGWPMTWDDPDDLAHATTVILKYVTDEEDIPMPTWRDSLEDFGSAWLTKTIPPDEIMLISPVDVNEYESKREYIEAVEAMEPTALTSLGAAFWAWLIMFMAQLVTERKTEIEEERRAATTAAQRRQRKTAKQRKKRKRKKTSGLGEVFW